MLRLILKAGAVATPVYVLGGGCDGKFRRRQIELAIAAKVNLLVKFQWVLRDLNSRKRKIKSKVQKSDHTLIRSTVH